jgi:hypothetical protein
LHIPSPNLTLFGAIKQLVLIVACSATAGLASERADTHAPTESRQDQWSDKNLSRKEKEKAAYQRLISYGRELGRLILAQAQQRHPQAPVVASGSLDARIQGYSKSMSSEDQTFFFKGRYNRSRARLPENIEKWRENPDIANPGPDLANWPNSAFTLPKGRAYIEFEPLSYSAGTTAGTPQAAQYSMDFLLRYGLTDDIELRVFGNGPTRTLGNIQSWNFAPLAFDTKIHVLDEHQELYLPALGIEAYIQTEWLGSTNTNSGTQPSINFNFDQSLPWEIDFEYNLGAVRILQTVDGRNTNVWEFSFQWSLQRDFFDEDFALFLHGYVNAPSLPRVPTAGNPAGASYTSASTYEQNVVGAGFLWTINSRLAVWGQNSFGTNAATPSILSNVGFALSF